MAGIGGKGRVVSGTVLCIVCLLLALPALQGKYGIMDDYSVLWKAANGGFSISQNAFTFLGRPLTALMLIPAMELAGTIEHLGWLRLAGLVGFLVYALVQDRVLSGFGWSLIPRLVAGMLTISSPAAVVWMDWAVCFPYAWGGVAGLIAGAVLLKDFRRTRSSWPTSFLSIGLLLVALCVYQPAASTFLVPLCVFSFQLRKETKLRSLLFPLLVFIGTHLMYFTFYKLIRGDPYAYNPMEVKSTIGTSLAINVGNFVTSVIPGSLAFWGAMASPVVFVVFGLVSVLTISFVLSGVKGHETHTVATWKGRLLTILIPVIFLFLSMATVLATEGVFYYRTRFGLYALLAVMAGEGTRRALLSSSRWKLIPLASAPVLVLVSTIAAGMGSWHGLVGPNAAEYREVRAAVESLELERVPRAILLVYDKSADRMPFGRSSRSLEYGTIGKDVSWAIEPMLRGLIRDFVSDDGVAGSTVALVVPAVPNKLLAAYPTVHIGESISAGSLECMVEEQTIFGSTVPLPGSGNGWFFSNVYGFINTTFYQPGGASYVYHLELGWLMVPPGQNPDDGLNFHQSDIGWIWTSATHYPNLYLKERGEWAYVQSDPYGQSYLLHEKSGLVGLSVQGFDDNPALGCN